MHKGTCFGNMWLYFTILLFHPDPHAKSPWSPLAPLLSCPKPSAVEALSRLPSPTQNLPISLNTTPVLPQPYFSHLPLYSHVVTCFEWLPMFPPFMLKHSYPSEVCSSACFASILSSDSFAPDFYSSFTSRTLDMKSTVDL